MTTKTTTKTTTELHWGDKVQLTFGPVRTFDHLEQTPWTNRKNEPIVIVRWQEQDETWSTGNTANLSKTWTVVRDSQRPDWEDVPDWDGSDFDHITDAPAGYFRSYNSSSLVNELETDWSSYEPSPRNLPGHPNHFGTGHEPLCAECQAVAR